MSTTYNLHNNYLPKFKWARTTNAKKANHVYIEKSEPRLHYTKSQKYTDIKLYSIKLNTISEL